MTAEFTESSALLDDPAALRARFAEDGYLFFRGLVPRDDVLEVRRDVAGAIASVGWLAAGSNPMDAVPGPEIRREADERWFEGYAEWQRQESFHRLGHHPALLGPVAALVGSADDVVVHPRKIGRVTFPGSAFPTPPHQDFPLVQGGTDVFTCWTPFGTVPVEMGGLRLLEGSHRSGMLPTQSASGVGGVGVQIAEDDPRWRTTAYEPGDALLFLSLTVHWAPANEADRVRLSGDYRYQSVREPLVEGSLIPHYGPPLVPTWDELTVGWSSKQWISVPDGVRVVDVLPLDQIEAPASAFI